MLEKSSSIHSGFMTVYFVSLFRLENVEMEVENETVITFKSKWFKVMEVII